MLCVLAMETVTAIIDKFGGTNSFALAIGTSQQNVTNMKARGSIPQGFWKATVKAAQQRGVDGVSLEILAELAARRREERVA